MQSIVSISDISKAIAHYNWSCRLCLIGDHFVGLFDKRDTEDA